MYIVALLAVMLGAFCLTLVLDIYQDGILLRPLSTRLGNHQLDRCLHPPL